MGEGKKGRGLWGHAAVDAALLSQTYRIPSVDLDAYAIEPAILGLVPRETCEQHRLIPVSRQGASLIVAMVDPTDSAALDALAKATGYAIEPVVADAAQLLAALARYYPRT
jgi:type IV pilus assembly protein PilB